jgi:phage FluMu gp28-like protein
MLGETTSVVSLTDDDANEVLEKTLRHARILSRFGSQLARVVREKEGVIELASGGRIKSSVQTRGGRGLTGNVVLDEFAYYKSPDEVWDGAAAATRLGFKLWGLSTPNGIGNLWHQLFTDPESHRGYSLYQTTIDEAAAQGMPVDWDECWKDAHGDERIFNQLYRCSFLDNDLQYLSDALISGCDATEERPKGTPSRYAGLDLGRINDLTARLIIDTYSDESRWVSDLKTLTRTSDADIDALVAEALNVHHCEKVCIDETGLGSFPVERLKKRYPKQVVGVIFTQGSKEDLATKLYQTCAEKRLRIPVGMPWSRELKQDMAAIRRIVSNAGNVTYDAPHTEMGHADRAWALALALHRAKPARGAATFTLDY